MTASHQIATLLEVLHGIVTLICTTGGYWVPSHYLPLYLLCLPYLLLDWHDRDRRCNLTHIANHIRHQGNLEETAEAPDFVQKVLHRLGIHASREEATRWLTLVIVVAWVVGFWRFTYIHKIRVFPHTMSLVVAVFFIGIWFVSQFIP